MDSIRFRAKAILRESSKVPTNFASVPSTSWTAQEWLFCLVDCFDTTATTIEDGTLL
jgi:hypothetical protein